MTGRARAPLSAVLICQDEVATIARALDGLAFADEIVVVDSGSTDGTLDLLAAREDVRLLHRPFDDFSTQKNFAVDQAAHDHVFVLDADEWVPADLASEVQAALEAPDTWAALRMRRENWFMGRPLRFAWGKDDVVRVFDRRRARFGARRVHESIEADGPVKDLRARLGHDPYVARGLFGHLQKMDRYSTLSALDKEPRTGRITAWHLLAKPLLAFLKRFFLRRACLDGIPGLFVAASGAWNVFLRYVKIHRLRAGESLGEGDGRATDHASPSD